MNAGPHFSASALDGRAFDGRSPGHRFLPAPRSLARIIILLMLLTSGFLTIGGQMMRLAISGGTPAHIVALTEPMTRTWARPAIVDRKGELLASDVATPSLYADPKLVIDRDEVVEKLRSVLPDLDEKELLKQLGEEGRRFVWIKRGLTPRLAQQIHDLGLPGLAFRKELHRVYPAGQVAPHIVGQVDIDNRGMSGIERFIDATDQAQPVLSPSADTRAPIRLTLDLSVQHAVRQELQGAIARYRAKAASAVVMDVDTGALLASVSLPDFDPVRPGAATPQERLDRSMGGVFELGSVFKAFTVAMALDDGVVTLATEFDTRQPLQIAGRRIDDYHGQKRLLSTAEIFVQSSNIGAALIALRLGGRRQRQHLERFGLLDELVMDGVGVALPLLPRRWTDLETATIAYGHGLAVTPLQFAAASAALVNGGVRVWPAILSPDPAETVRRRQAIKPETSRMMRELMRLNVTDPKGTGRRANVPGYEIGGKTGSADVARNGGYADHAVVASFLAAFPMSRPKYVTLLTLFEPEPTMETKAQITAGVNAAPATGRMIARIAPLLGVRARSDGVAKASLDGAGNGIADAGARERAAY